MKHSNPTMRKPSLGKVNFDLSKSVVNPNDPNYYVVDCPDCGHTFAFQQKDIPGLVVKCPNCGWEEVFFKDNYKWDYFANQTEESQAELRQVFKDLKERRTTH